MIVFLTKKNLFLFQNALLLTMENILSNQGLIHIRDQIFGDFTSETLEICLQVSNHWNECLEDLFWLSLVKYLYECGDKGGIFRGRFTTVRERIPGWDKGVQKYSEEASIEDLKEVKKSLHSLHWFTIVVGALRLCHLKLTQFLFLTDYDFSRPYPVDHYYTSSMIDLAYFDNSSIEMVKLMVDSSKEAGIDLNGTDIHGNTAFMKACKRGHLDIIKLLINSSKEFDIDLNARYIDERPRPYKKTNFGNTACIFACIKGQTEAVKWMIEKRIEFGIDITKEDNRGKNPLECVDAIIEKSKQDPGLDEVKVILENEYSKLQPVPKRRKVEPRLGYILKRLQ